jgi:hypothetical protein
MDVVGGFALADGTHAKALAGIDDHSAAWTQWNHGRRTSGIIGVALWWSAGRWSSLIHR